MRLIFASLILVASALPAAAQKTYEIRQPTGPWRVPGEIQQPRGTWQTPGTIQQPANVMQKPGELQKPAEMQKPAEIQVRPATQTVRAVVISSCERRLSVVGDALFDFDRANLRPDAEETLMAAAAEIRQGGKPVQVEGHTDSKGGDAYNIRLSEARATTVRDWMASQRLIPAETPIKGYGKTKPAVPNITADGQDDPEGRQKNRRVEVVFDTCK
jgi:outer membrane protein OmpA-like peptidoglycan-associated protein